MNEELLKALEAAYENGMSQEQAREVFEKHGLEVEAVETFYTQKKKTLGMVLLNWKIHLLHLQKLGLSLGKRLPRMSLSRIRVTKIFQGT